jgi:hypothetical protein
MYANQANTSFRVLFTYVGWAFRGQTEKEREGFNTFADAN